MSEVEIQKQPIRLETDQLGLVLIEMNTPEDDAAYFELQNTNLDYWNEFGNTIDATVEAVTKRRTESVGPRFGIYKDGVLIGMEGYTASPDGKEAEVGILMAKDVKGHGYATSAVKALSDFIETQFERVFAEVEPNNVNSVRLLERTGYHRTGEEVFRCWGRAAVFEFKN